MPVRFKYSITLPNGIKYNPGQKAYIPIFASKFFDEHCVRCDILHLSQINQLINDPVNYNLQNKYFFRIHKNMKSHFIKRMRVFSKYIYKESFCDSELNALDKVEKLILVESRKNYNLFNK